MEKLVYDTIYLNEKTNWWYRVRRVIVKNLINKYAKAENKKLKILDVGCGMGLLLKELAQFGDVLGIDNSKIAIDYCHKRGAMNVQLGEIENIPFSTDKFDVVLALDILEHIEDDNKGIQEIKRVLNPGGLAIIFVPTYKFLWSVNDEVNHHLRRYTLNGLKRKVEQNNLLIIKASYFNTFLFLPIAIFRLSVNALHLKTKADTEVIVTGGWIQEILYHIFLAEALFLKFLNFPFGVSSLIVAKKYGKQ